MACELHSRSLMTRISDVLELMTVQHEEIDALLTAVLTAPATERALAVAALTAKLTAHLAVEQDLLYPELTTLVPPRVMRELLDEHAAIKRVLAELLARAATGEPIGEALGCLSTLLVGHTRWQEEHLFLEVAEALPRDTLASISERACARFEGARPLARVA